MIVMVCGLMGAGKTTYARKNYKYFTDFDGVFSKERQVAETIRLHEEGKVVAHITCFPTRYEQIALMRYSPEMIWIDTSYEQAMRNVMARRRGRDMSRLQAVAQKNMQFLNSKAHDSNFEWTVIKGMVME